MATAVTLRTLDGATHELLVVGDTFAAVGTAPVDGELATRTLYALPGLADCHAHLNAERVGVRPPPEQLAATMARHCWAQLSAGVFLVMDKGTHDAVTLRVQDAPPTERPELSMAGVPLTDPGGYYRGLAREVDVADLQAAVAEAAATAGAGWVKLIGDWPRKGVGARANFDTDALATVVGIAHAGGCRVAIHACAPHTSSMAVAAGVDSIEHGLFLTADDVAALGARRGAWVPTIAAMEAIRDMLGAESSGGRLFADGLVNVRALLAGARSAGVHVLAGTDLGLAHGAVATEALRLAAYGMSPEEVVDVLAGAAWRYLGIERAFAPGMAADAVFFDADPRDDLSVLARPALVLRHGRVIPRP